jgi:hypothetical protein
MAFQTRGAAGHVPPVTWTGPALARGAGHDSLSALRQRCRRGADAYVALPAIPTTGAFNVVDPSEPQKKASP